MRRMSFGVMNATASGSIWSARRAPGHRTGVPVFEHAAGGEHHRIL